MVRVDRWVGGRWAIVVVVCSSLRDTKAEEKIFVSLGMKMTGVVIEKEVPLVWGRRLVV